MIILHFCVNFSLVNFKTILNDSCQTPKRHVCQHITSSILQLIIGVLTTAAQLLLLKQPTKTTSTYHKPLLSSDKQEQIVFFH